MQEEGSHDFFITGYWIAKYPVYGRAAGGRSER
jgi:hypothetical protein